MKRYTAILLTVLMIFSMLVPTYAKVKETPEPLHAEYIFKFITPEDLWTAGQVAEMDVSLFRERDGELGYNVVAIDYSYRCISTVDELGDGTVQFKEPNPQGPGLIPEGGRWAPDETMTLPASDLVNFVTDYPVGQWKLLFNKAGVYEIYFEAIAKETVDGVDVEVIAAKGVHKVQIKESTAKKAQVGEIFRKNISKTEDMESAKAKLELMQQYVTARASNGDEVALKYTDADGNVTYRYEAKPLISVYADEVPGTGGAMDVFASISRDEGQTWKIANLSRSADKSSFTLANGTVYPGDTHKPVVKVSGENILVVWTSKFAASGRPTFAIDPSDEYTADDQYHQKDVWGVGGSQRSFDYTEIGYPEVGEIPFSTVWTCRGTIESDGDIVWYKPERLTSGRRDANQVAVNGIEGVGFSIIWQEDAEYLNPGEAEGPGEGWSGATTNHKSDLWYSFINWKDFDDVDTMFEGNGDDLFEADKEVARRAKAEVPFKLPVRLSDNDVLNADNLRLKLGQDENGNVTGPYKDQNGKWVIDETITPESINDGNGDFNGSHEYALQLGVTTNGAIQLMDDDAIGYETFIKEFQPKTNQQGVEKWVAVTHDGRVMDGDTGGSRPNVMLQKYKKADGTYSAYAMIAYEESKGAGSGTPLENHDSTILDVTEDTGSSHERVGKNVIYHTFDFDNPEMVSEGVMLNPTYVDSEGNEYTENARRPRLLLQSKDSALKGKGDNEVGTVMVALFKMGEEGMGRPSDIFMRRWVVSKSTSGNPYSPANLIEEVQNVSSVTPTETWDNPDKQTNLLLQDSGMDPVKVVRWTQDEDNIMDSSGDNPYDDANAHRGFIKNDFLAIAYDWTPNWAAARNGNDVYNLYIRRSFDGGKTWTTDPDGNGVTHTDTFKIYDVVDETDLDNSKDQVVVETTFAAGAFEPARNISQIINTKQTVIEPRLVGVPGSISSGYPEDTQDVSSFWLTWGTSTNPKPKKNADLPEPLDLFYTYSTDFGETLYQVEKEIDSEESNNFGEVVMRWDWLAKDRSIKGMAQAECQIRMSPDGSVFYAVWNEEGPEGSDVMFRRILRDGGSIEAIDPAFVPVVEAVQ